MSEGNAKKVFEYEEEVLFMLNSVAIRKVYKVKSRK